MDDLCGGIFIAIYQVFRYILLDKLFSLGWHPGMYKGSQVEKRRSIEGQVVVDDSIGDICADPL
jgi:hypothetical protein